MSQAKLAVQAGMDLATLNRLEQGKGNPNIRTLERVAAALGVEVVELLPKAKRRSSPEPKSFDGLEDERHPSILADAITAAAETWLTAVTDPDINIHKRFGIRDAAIELFDRINERLIGKLETLPLDERNKIVLAMKKLNEIPEEAYRAMLDETLKESLEARRKKIRRWTQQISA